MTSRKNDRRPISQDLNAGSVIATGELTYLSPSDIRPSQNNPRHLFDPEPLQQLKESIRQHGVLVPIIVYKLKAQDKYSIIDGERRFRCCLDLLREGHSLEIPANVVAAPNKIAGILYMFSIHNYREQWELMPTALSLKVVMSELTETDTKSLKRLTGLSEPQIERCKILLTFPERFQNLSLDIDPVSRIPSNFWIEAHPVLNYCPEYAPDLFKRLGRDGITDILVDKYRKKAIRSVIHFRRIVEAIEVNEDDKEVSKAIRRRLQEYLNDISYETRRAFDEFVMDNRRVRSAIEACAQFRTRLDRSKLAHVVDADREELTVALRDVLEYVTGLLQNLEGTDAPTIEEEDI